MKIPKINNRLSAAKVLFVWDGNLEAIKPAEQFLNSLKQNLVRSIKVLPHQAIRAYATAGLDCSEKTAVERMLYRDFERAVYSTKYLKLAKLELVFGERITEITRFAEQMNADLILMPRFRQSSFSTWIHGDLNQRLLNETNCRVVFLDPKVAPIANTQTGSATDHRTQPAERPETKM